MSFGSANIVLKNNRNLLSSLKNRRKRYLENYSGRHNNSEAIKVETIKPWVNKAIRERLQKSNRNRAIKTWTLMTFFIAVLVYIIVNFF